MTMKKDMPIKLVTVCHCPSCDTPIKVPIKKLGQIISSERQIKPTNEFMKMISRKGVLTRKKNAKIKNKVSQQRP
jgi:hypothetical protein